MFEINYNPSSDYSENLIIFGATKESQKKKFDLNEIEFKEIKKIADKDKWINRFMKSYKGGKTKVSTKGIDTSKVFIATRKGIELGYTRIYDVTHYYSGNYDGTVYRLAESYVKPLYRNQGVVTALRKYVVEREHVKLLKIETERFLYLKDYFNQEGFIHALVIRDTDMSLICKPDFLEVIIKVHSVINEQ